MGCPALIKFGLLSQSQKRRVARSRGRVEDRILQTSMNQSCSSFVLEFHDYSSTKDEDEDDERFQPCAPTILAEIVDRRIML